MAGTRSCTPHRTSRAYSPQRDRPRAEGQEARAGEAECHPANDVGEPCAGEPHVESTGNGPETDTADHGSTTLKPAREPPARTLPTVDTAAHRTGPLPNQPRSVQ